MPNTTKAILLLPLFFLTMIPAHSQFIVPQNEGVYMKIAAGRSIGFDQVDLEFTSGFTSGSLTFAPGGGLSLEPGVGIASGHFDFELSVEPIILLGAFVYTGSNGTGSMVASFFKTNVCGSVFFKIATQSDHLPFVRIGGGPHVVLPGKFRVSIDGNEVGSSSYAQHIGFHINADVVLRLIDKPLEFNAGIRIRSNAVNSTSNSFTQNTDDVEELNLSGLCFYFGLTFGG